MSKWPATRFGYRAGRRVDKLLHKLQEQGLDETDAIILPPLAATAAGEAYAGADLYERRQRRKKDEIKRKRAGLKEGGPVSERERQRREGERQRWGERHILGIPDPPPVEINEGESFRQYIERTRKERMDKKIRYGKGGMANTPKPGGPTGLDYIRGAGQSLANQIPFVEQETRDNLAGDLTRLLGGAASQWYAPDPDTGEPTFFLNALKDAEDYDPWKPDELREFKRGESGRTPTPGLVTETLGLPADFMDIYGALSGSEEEMNAPDWSRAAQADTELLRTGMMDELQLDQPSGWKEHGLEAGGVMLGQLPFGGIPAISKNAPGALAKLAKSLGMAAEWFTPTVDPKLANYAVGTAVGSGMGVGSDYIVNEQIEKLKTEIQAEVDSGKLTPEEAEYILSEFDEESDIVEPSEDEETYVTGGKFGKGGRVDTKRIMDAIRKARGLLDGTVDVEDHNALTQTFSEIMGDLESHAAETGIPVDEVFQEFESLTDEILPDKPGPFFEVAEDAPDGPVFELPQRHAKGGRVGRPSLLTPQQLNLANRMHSEGQSIAAIADILDVPYARLYKRMIRAGYATVTPPSNRTVLTPAERLAALERHLAGESQRAVADDVGVVESDIAHLKRRMGEIEGHAKGGRVKPPDLMQLRQKLGDLLRESESIKAPVPTDPMPGDPNLPTPETPFRMPDDMPAPPDTNLPASEPMSMSRRDVSRRDVLRGMTDLAGAAMSPVELSLSDLARSVGEAPGAAVKTLPNLSPAQVARHLSSIWETAFGMSDDAIDDLLVAAEEAKRIPGSEGLVAVLEKTYKDLEDLGNVREGDHDEYAKLYDEVHRDIQEEMAKIADAHGVLARVDQWEDMGGPESGPGPLVPLDPMFAEPMPGGAKSLHDWIDRTRDVESARRLGIPDPDEAHLAIADELETLLNEFGPRADMLINESVMNAGHGPLNEGFKAMAERLKARGFNISSRDLWTMLNSSLDSNYSDHGDMTEWFRADPEDRARIIELYNRPPRPESWPEAQPLEDEYSSILDRIYGPGSDTGPRE